MNEKGVLVVLSGFSGVGKGTLIHALRKKYPDYSLSISATTRRPREGEEDGVSYFFKTLKEFELMITENAFIEYAKYVDNYYGTPRAYVEEKLSEGKDVILEIEIQGAMKVKEQFPEAVLLFVTAPDAKTLKQRLTNRGTETEAVIHSRLERAVEESKGIEEYEYLIVNDDLDTAVEQMHLIISAAHFRSKNNIEYIATMKQNLKEYLKGE